MCYTFLTFMDCDQLAFQNFLILFKFEVKYKLQKIIIYKLFIVDIIPCTVFALCPYQV